MSARKVRWFALAWLSLSLAAGRTAPAIGNEFHPHRLLVTARSGVAVGAINRVHDLNGGRIERNLEGGRLQVVTLPADMTVTKAISNYLGSGLFLAAEPDYARHLALSPNDPRVVDGTLWALHNYGQSGGVADADIDAPEAWDTLTSASNVVVALLDTGIRATHEDLAANIWTNPVSGGYGWNSISNTAFPADDEGHGSLVAGVLGAVGNNGKGVAGVAWRVQLMACKCFDNQKLGYDSDIIEAIEFACTNGARIINASMGSYAYSQALSNAIYSARQRGIIFVAACGNDSRNIDATPYYPACYDIDNVVSVAFTARDDALGSLSNYGAGNVDLAAPGAAMYSTFFAADNSYLGGVYFVGTSFAAPYVSGALALTIARYPSEPYTRTIQRLFAGVDTLPSLAGRCRTAGRLNVNNIINPAIALSITQSGPRGFIITGHTSPGRACVLQASDDLSNWSNVCSRVSSEEGSFQYADLLTATGGRYYRAVASQ